MDRREQVLRDGTSSSWLQSVRTTRAAALMAGLTAAAGLSACASISEKMAGAMSEVPVIGLPAGAPERPADPPPYPAVHDMPPPRSNAVLTEIERQKMETDLVAARERQQAAAGSGSAASKKPPPPRVVPVSSGSSIY
jgi:hypothetical protein